jgi:hypothetical protein
MNTYALLLLALLAPLASAAVRVIFDPVRALPFPTDFRTVPDPLQRTGLRIDMPLPNCAAEPSTCGELNIINQLDGFSLQPRARVQLSGPVDPNTLRSGIWFVWLDQLRTDEFGLGPAGQVTAINNVVYDPQTNTVLAKPDAAFDQARRYALIVTDAVRDTNGQPLEMDPAFEACLDRRIGGEYCVRLSEAVAGARSSFSSQSIVGGSVFTTLTATHFLESARRALQGSDPMFRRAAPAMLAIRDIAGVTLHNHVRTSGERFDTVPLTFPSSLLELAGAGRVAFGSIRSPRFFGPAFFIPQTPTAQEVTLPQQLEELPFQVYLPARAAPPGGYPVVIAGHGITDSRFGMPTGLIPGLVGAGNAVIAINAVGHGFGPESTIELTDRTGASLILPAGGRGADLDGDGRIDSAEGAVVLAPGAPYLARDALRQTAVDLMQLTRAIRMGMDLDGDGTTDLSRENIAYVGHSLGAMYGTLFHAIEPDVRSAVLNAGAGTAVETVRFSPSLQRFLLFYLGTRTPPLLNAPPGFRENYPLRYQPVVVNGLPGAIAIQDALDRLEWIEMPGAPAAYATHLYSSTLPGVPIKRALFQFAWGDMTTVNPANLMLLRHANLWPASSVFRSDRARAVSADLPRDPHTFLVNLLNVSGAPIALAAQEQAVRFLAGSDTLFDPNPNLRGIYGVELFEPASLQLENLNFAAQ